MLEICNIFVDAAVKMYPHLRKGRSDYRQIKMHNERHWFEAFDDAQSNRGNSIDSIAVA